jgi:hypothetical protein
MSWLRDLARVDEQDVRAARIGRHTVLLISLVVLFVALPLLRELPGGRLRFSVLFALVLLAAIYVNSVRRWLFVAGASLGVLAIAAVAFAEATGSTVARLVSGSLGLVLLVMTILMMLNTLMRTRRVSHDTIVGGICVYLMLGLAFASAYQIAMVIDPSVLAKDGVPLGEAVTNAGNQSAQILYYSYVTLTTLGFGDITPRAEPVQLLTVVEAVVGQLYVAIFIARLMGLYIAGDREPAEAPRGHGGSEREG